MKNEINIVEALRNFHAALADINSNLDKVFAQIRFDAVELQKLCLNLKNERILWPLEDAEKHLQMIIFLADVGKPQFLQYDDFIVQVTSAKD